MSEQFRSQPYGCYVDSNDNIRVVFNKEKASDISLRVNLGQAYGSIFVKTEDFEQFIEDCQTALRKCKESKLEEILTN